MGELRKLVLLHRKIKTTIIERVKDPQKNNK